MLSYKNALKMGWKFSIQITSLKKKEKKLQKWGDGMEGKTVPIAFCNYAKKRKNAEINSLSL